MALHRPRRRKLLTQPPNPQISNEANPPGRRRRIPLSGTLFLLAVAIAVTAGLFYAQYRLQDAIDDVQLAIEERTGGTLSVRQAAVNGLRGIRLDDVAFAVNKPGEPSVTLSAPAILVHIDFIELFSGRVTIDRVTVNDASMSVTRPPDSEWLSSSLLDLDELLDEQHGLSFRILGKNGTLNVSNVVADSQLSVDRIDFDVSRLADARDIAAHVDGYIRGREDKRIRLRIFGEAFDNFSLRADTTLIDRDDISVFLPGSKDVILSGTGSASVRIGRFPDSEFTVSVKSPFEELTIRDQPDFIRPSGGELTALATYEPESNELRFTTAQVVTDQLTGAITGSILFGHDTPRLDLTLESSRLPATDFLRYVLADRAEDFRELDVSLGEDCEVTVSLTGTTADPYVVASAQAESGAISFIPADSSLVEGRLKLGRIQGAWNSRDRQVEGRFVVASGTVLHKNTGLTAEDLSGTVLLGDGRIELNPMTALFTGEPFVGQGHYDYENKTGEFTFNGNVAKLEELGITEEKAEFQVAGSVGVRGKLAIEPERYVLTGDVEATQSFIQADWWLKKPVGIGASAKVVAELRPKESLHVEIDGIVATTPAHGTIVVEYDEGLENPWDFRKFYATSDNVQINAASEVVPIPYTFRGTVAREASFLVTRNGNFPDQYAMEADLLFEEVTMRAKSDNAGAMLCKNLRLAMDVVKSQKENYGVLELHADEGDLPSFSETWFVEMLPPPEDMHLYARGNRVWTFKLSANTVSLPPWRGTDFEAEAYTTPDTGGFNWYRGVLDGGRIEGNYHSDSIENTYRMSANWTDVPAKYFLDHLKFERVFTGAMTGEVAYGVDRDDPGTLRGNGSFSVRDGQFSADFVLGLLEERMPDDVGALPHALKFSSLKMGVEFQEDVVITDGIEFLSENLKVGGDGRFIWDGDMDYNLKVAVDPDFAEQVPSLSENLPIQGHRLAQQDVELAFKITGPTFRPKSEVAKLPPASVTLVSGALELTSEAFRVINTPRRILTDLLKIGGGLVGTSSN